MNVKLLALVGMQKSNEDLTYDLLECSNRDQHELEFTNATPKDIRRLLCIFLESIAWRRAAYLEQVMEQGAIPPDDGGREYVEWLWAEFKLWFGGYGRIILTDISRGCLIPHRLARI